VGKPWQGGLREGGLSTPVIYLYGKISIDRGAQGSSQHLLLPLIFNHKTKIILMRATYVLV
jgi:hypothetical protein